MQGYTESLILFMAPMQADLGHNIHATEMAVRNARIERFLAFKHQPKN